MIGSIIIWIAFISTLVSIVLYFRSTQQHGEYTYARSAFLFSAGCVLIAAMLLMSYILRHRFEYNYVSSYSSRDIPLSLLITTFWAGQEGSFMLWTLFVAIIGLVLQRYSLKKQIEGEVMTVYSVVLAFLILLISIKSPFEYIWQAQSDIPIGTIPQDGRGLNPLLQNFWMIIHPPTLFVGFSSLAVPFVLAIAALWQKKYSNWILPALPWVLFSALSLGAGLTLGGYWAYGVLGWGGWWGWDPVENSSLIPWIVTIILIHTMLIQIFTGKLVRTNFVLAVMSYLLVVYSTFLTRSGILANASVHSFVDPGAFAYALLLIWLAVIIVIGFGLIFLRRKDLAASAKPSGMYSRESVVSIAALVMGACALVILFGTSMPLFSKTTVEPSFYDKTNLPLAVLLTFLLGFSLLAKWNREDKHMLLKELIIPLIISVVVLTVVILIGVHEVTALILTFASFFALILALQQGYRLIKERPQFIGGSLSHAGLAILLLGIIGSGKYGQKQSTSLQQNQSQQVFGYSVTYVGATQTEDGKAHFAVRVERNGSTSTLMPIMFESSYNNSIMRTPDYFSLLTKDIYVEPVSFEPGSDAVKPENLITLRKGEPIEYGPITITFMRFQMGEHGKENMMGEGSATIGAVLEIKTDKGVEEVIPMTTYKQQGMPEIKTAYMKSGHLGFQLISMNIPTGNEKSIVHVNIVGSQGLNNENEKQKPDILVVEISVKPFMNLVWIAAALIISGLTIAMVRRLRKDITV